MILTQKVRINPSPEQEIVLWQLSERCRLLYNFALTERKIIFKQEKQKPLTDRIFLNYRMQQNGLPSLKNRFPEYQWIYSKVLQLTLKTLDADFKSFFALWKKGDKNARPPKYKGKNHFVTLKYNQSGFKVTRSHLKLSHKHPSKVPLVFPLAYTPKGEVKQVELFYDQSRENWFVSFNTDIIVPSYTDNGLYQAFDLGIKNVVSAVNLQEKYLQFASKRPDKHWQPKIQQVQSKRDKCKKYSNRWFSYNKKLSKMIRKQANQFRDYQHKLTSVLVDNTKANTLIVGKPSVKHMAQKQKGSGSTLKNKRTKNLHRSLQNTGLMSRFLEWLTYKAEKVGKKVITIDEAYTTQICPQCGKKEHKQLSQRQIMCKQCGLALDRDLASALNIMSKFLLYKQDPAYLSQQNLLHQSSVNEELFQLRWNGFLRQTVKGQTKVTLTSFTWLEFGELVGSPIL